MSLTINTNISSLTTQRNLSKSQNSLKTSMERLSSGLRINSAKDDAAGLAITDRMTSQIRGLNQAARNANDGISLAQTAEGAMQESVNMLQRIRELAIQSANATNSDSDRASLQAEVSQLIQEMGRISSDTAFNGINLLDGTFQSQNFQIGANAGEAIDVSIENINPTHLGTETSTTVEQESLGYDVSPTAFLILGTYSGQTDNSTAPHVIDGPLGSATVSLGANETVKNLVDLVNAQESNTGVTAEGETKVRIEQLRHDNSTVYPETWTVRITGAITTDISFVLNDSTDLQPLADEINSLSSTLHITAEVEPSGSVMLTNDEGYDIALGDLRVVDNNGTTVAGLIDMRAINQEGNTVSGTATLQGNHPTHSFTFGSNITYTSDGPFTVEHEGTTYNSAIDTGNTVEVNDFDSVSEIDVSTQQDAQEAIPIVDDAIAQIDEERSNLGAVQNRFESTISNLKNITENLQAARSRILDADIAKESSNLTKQNILQQAGVSILSQANQQPQLALSLLG